MRLRHDQPPALGADPLNIASHIALLVLAILEDAALVGEGEGAEKNVADTIAGEDQPDIPLRAAKLAETLQRPFLTDAAGESGIRDKVEVSRVFRAEFDHPAAVHAVRDRRAGNRCVWIEQRTLARDLCATASLASRSERIDERRTPVAQPDVVILADHVAIGCGPAWDQTGRLLDRAAPDGHQCKCGEQGDAHRE